MGRDSEVAGMKGKKVEMQGVFNIWYRGVMIC